MSNFASSIKPHIKIMDKPQNKYIAVAYKLYTAENGESNLVEEATEERPFQFISGFGVTLDAFEKEIAGLEPGAEFDFELTKDEAYGDYEEAHVLDLDREMFCINGHFDHEHIFKDAVVPLQNADGNRFFGRVLDISDDGPEPPAGRSDAAVQGPCARKPRGNQRRDTGHDQPPER